MAKSRSAVTPSLTPIIGDRKATGTWATQIMWQPAWVEVLTVELRLKTPQEIHRAAAVLFGAIHAAKQRGNLKPLELIQKIMNAEEGIGTPTEFEWSALDKMLGESLSSRQT